MKKAFFTLAVALLAATGAWAQTTFTAENLKYTVTDETTHTVELTGYETKPTGTLTIPATVTNESTEYSVTSIGESAFAYCSSLTAVTISDGVTSIGSSAFKWCNQLTAVTIPASVTSIGESAFAYCSSLTAVTISDGVTSIGTSAFSSCSSLTEVNIPASVTNIGSWVFDYCSALTAIHVAEGNTAYSSEDGVLFNKDKTTLVCYPIGKPETTYTVPSTVTMIGSSAFINCTALTLVTLPEGLTNISNRSFEGCAALAQINLPNSLTSIANRAFYGCTSLTEVTLPDGLTQIEFNTFYGCSALEKVTLPEGITYIGNKAFYNCSALTELTVWAITPPTLENDAFTGVGSSLVVYVPAEGLSAYQAADIWMGFTLQGNGQAPFVVGNLKYRVTSQTKNTVEVMGYQTAPTDALTIPANVTYNEVTYTVTGIKEQVFANCSALTSVSLPDGLTTIGNKTFEYCSSLATVSIGNSVTTIGNAAFANCTSLTGITLPDGLTTIGNEAFFNCTSLTGITIPNTVTSIGIAAFRNSGLTTASIGNGVTTIGNNAFYACWALTQFNVDEANTAYCSDGGVLFNKDKTTLLQYPAGKTETTYAVPANVTSIAEYAFAWCRNLTKISLPESLDNIGNVAFNECTGLTEMTVLATTPPTVGSMAFNSVSRTIPVYVPAASLADYQTAAVWNEFTDLQAISTTGLQTPAMPESIRMQGGMLHNPQGLHLTLYDMQGRQVYSGTDATVSQPAGVYVVRYAGASGKVVF